MKKPLKRILLGTFLILFAFLLKLPNIEAASCRISVSAPSSAVVGQTFKVSVSVPSNAGSWEYTLSYDSSKVRLVSGQLHVVGVKGDSMTNSYTFTALKSGSASFKPVNASILDYASVTECLSGVGSATVSMKTQAEIEASYSKNNNLSALSVEGAELSPAFSSDTLEYTATLPIDTEKAIINATVADKNAAVTGAGEIAVQDGINKVEIVVTAQHGEKKTYVINLTVLELDPIKVKVDGKEYSIVRKKGQIEKVPSGFEETIITIDNQEINAYKSDLAKLTLVGLKDVDGNISLFIYDNKKFTKFNEAQTAALSLIIFNDITAKVPDGFTKENIKINEKEVTAFTFSKKRNSNYYLVYAMDLSNGRKDFYLYDKENGTYQKYYNELTEFKDEQIEIRNYIIIGFLSLLALTIIVSIIKAASSKEKKIEKYQRKINKYKGNFVSEENIDVMDKLKSKEVVVKKIEDHDFVVPKKSRKERAKELEEARKKLDSKKNQIRRVSLEETEDDEM